MGDAPLIELVAAVGAFGAVFACVAACAVLFASRGRTTRSDRPPVVLLRCAETIDDELRARWAPDERAYDGELHRIVVSAAQCGLANDAVGNRKALQLAIAHREAWSLGWITRDTVVVHADADVELQAGDLDRLVAATDARTTAFAAPSPRGGTKLAELLARAAITASPQAFATVDALARITGGAPALAGKLVAIPQAELEAIGGYESLVASIGDDVALVDALRARGGRVRMAPVVAVTVNDRRTVRSVSDQLARWLRVASLHRPGLLWTYPTLVASLPIALALAPLHPTAALAAACLYAARLALGAALILGPYRGRSSLLALAVLPLADLMLLRAAWSAAGRTHVTWGRRIYRLGPGGSIEGVDVGSDVESRA